MRTETVFINFMAFPFAVLKTNTVFDYLVHTTKNPSTERNEIQLNYFPFDW
jgi:hypothetical protein